MSDQTPDQTSDRTRLLELQQQIGLLSAEMRRARHRSRLAAVGVVVALLLGIAAPVTAYALAIRSVDIVNGEVKTPDIGAAAVTTAKLKDAAVTTVKLKPGSVGPAQLQAGAVGSAQLQPASVGASQLQDQAITSPALQDGIVLPQHLAPSAVTVKAFATIWHSGTSVTGNRNLTVSNVLHPATGIYCIHSLGFTPTGAVGSNTYQWNAGRADVTIWSTGNQNQTDGCPGGTQVQVRLYDPGTSTLTNANFNILIY